MISRNVMGDMPMLVKPLANDHNFLIYITSPNLFLFCVVGNCVTSHEINCNPLKSTESL